VLSNNLGTITRKPSGSRTPEEASALNPNQAFARSLRKSAAPKQRVASKRKPRQTTRKILVVDDVADVTDMVALFLSHAGFEVATANSPKAAIELAADTPYDLVISDIGMPEMNGYELAESLRARNEYSVTPLIAMTGYTEYDDRGRSLQAGFNAHLTKPINPSQLLNLIEELLD
jgi:CheY-like chemotaxis protein